MLVFTDLQEKSDKATGKMANRMRGKTFAIYCLWFLAFEYHEC